MSKTSPHYTILKALYDLYNENKDNQAVLDKVSAICWSLEHELDFDNFGYFELSELINYSNQQNAANHYVQVIEDSLKKLYDENQVSK